MEKRKITGIIEESFLGDLLSLHVHLHEKIGSYSNLLLIISTFIFALLFNSLVDANFLGFDIYLKISIGFIMVSSFIVILINLFIIRPNLSGKGPLNIFYYGSFLRRMNKKEYNQKIERILKKEEDIVKAYTDEIYELSEEVLFPTYKKIKLCTEILVGGVSLGIFFLILSFFL